MVLSAPIGIFGGTFDPPHLGHINPVIEAAKLTKITRIAALPCYVPTHKQAASASSQDRLNMVRRVCELYPLFYPDSRDIDRGVPTFTLDSLQSFKTEFTGHPLCFFIGSDSLLTLTTWHQWREILDLCHLVVCTRSANHAQYQSCPITVDVLQEYQTPDWQTLHTQSAGSIYLADTQQVDISSTELRQRLQNKQSCNEYVPKSVLDYIDTHKLYQP
jgi:nicotinate-nucleotide adenylyltransferase